MNFTLKALVAAVALVAAGSANAAYHAAGTGNSDLVLYVADTSTKASFAIDLTLQNAAFTDIGVQTLTGTSVFTVPSTFGTNWTNFLKSASTGNMIWAVVGADTKTKTGDKTLPGDINLVATANVTTANADTTAGNAISNASFVSAAGHVDGTYATKLGTGSYTDVSSTGAVTTGNGYIYNVGPNLQTTQMFDTSNSIATSASGFYLLTGNGTTSSVSVTKMGDFSLTFNGATGASLSYTALPVVASVPESDTYAMLLAGLGVMGFVARRRLAV